MVTCCSDTMILGGGFKHLCTIVAQKNQGTCWSETVVVYSGGLKRPSIIKTQKYMVPWCSDTGIFLVVSNNLSSLSTEIFEINMSFEYGLDADLF